MAARKESSKAKEEGARARNAFYAQVDCDILNDPRVRLLPSNDAVVLYFSYWFAATAEKSSALPRRFNAAHFANECKLSEDSVIELTKAIAEQGLVAWTTDGLLVVWGAEKRHSRMAWRVSEKGLDTRNPFKRDKQDGWGISAEIGGLRPPNYARGVVNNTKDARNPDSDPQESKLEESREENKDARVREADPQTGDPEVDPEPPPPSLLLTNISEEEFVAERLSKLGDGLTNTQRQSMAIALKNTYWERKGGRRPPDTAVDPTAAVRAVMDIGKNAQPYSRPVNAYEAGMLDLEGVVAWLAETESRDTEDGPNRSDQEHIKHWADRCTAFIERSIGNGQGVAWIVDRIVDYYNSLDATKTGSEITRPHRWISSEMKRQSDKHNDGKARPGANT